jgi:hypothetical protein
MSHHPLLRLDAGGARQLDHHRTVAAVTIGYLAVISSMLYFVSDVVEVVQGRFSTGQLWLTLIAEATIPIFVIGFAVIRTQRPLGWVGDLSAVVYAYAFLYFTGTVVYALTNGTRDYEVLTGQLGLTMTAHGVMMVVAGVGFGCSVIHARLFPTWTAVALIAGVVLVALAQGLPDGVQLIAAGIRDVGFAGMGVAQIRSAMTPKIRPKSRPTH